MPVSSDGLQATVDNTIVMARVSDAKLDDYHDVANALRQGSRGPATLSYEIRWSGVTGGDVIRNAEQRFSIRFAEMNATMTFRAETEQYSFVSTPSKSTFAAFGDERNGVFFA